METERVQSILEQYLAKVTGFAYLKSGNKHDADDLAQDIAVELIKTLGRERREISNIPAYIYKICSNVFYKRIRQSKKVLYVELTGLEYAEDHNLDGYLCEEDIAVLRRGISFLSSAYRDIVVDYYFENLGIVEIAAKRRLAPGTVKWWLFEARKQLKKGFDTVRANGEKSFNPGHLHLAISGSLGFDNSPFNLVHGNLLAQNILLEAYRKPRAIGDLAQELGVSCPYVESEVKRLIDAELMREADGRRCQTDFIISNNDLEIGNHLILEDYFADLKNIVLAFIDKEWQFFESPTVNVAGFDRKRILWTAVYLVMDLIHRTTFDKLVDSPPLPQRPNGGRWIALGFDKTKTDLPEGYEPNRYGYNGPMSSYYGDGTYGERLIYHYYSGYRYPEYEREILQDTQSKDNSKILLCIKTAQGPVDADSLTELDKEGAADAIKFRLVKRCGDLLKPNFVFVPKASLNRFQETCSGIGEELLPIFNKIVGEIENNFRDKSPENVWNQISNFSSVDFRSLIPMILDDLYKSGELSEPCDDDKHLLSYYIWG